MKNKLDFCIKSIFLAMHSKFNMCYAFTYQEVRFWRCSDRDAAIGSAKKKKMDFGSRLEPSDSIAESVPE